MRYHPAELIARKRDGGELGPDEIGELVHGVVDGSIGDAQLGAFLMAVLWRGMSVAETTRLTLAMRDSGRVLDLSGVDGPKIDKHSTGGVGDKVSLLLAPWVAAAGVRVPMISGRGLGHTGGTIDKLEAIPGYRTDLPPEEFHAVLCDCGFVIAGASGEIAPADRRIYATRDVTGTVSSIPLITSSILAKKLAEGIDGLVLDVKFGRAAFLGERAQAETLLDSLVMTGAAAGLPVTALLTDMDVPLGRAVGNALEVREIVDCLEGRGPADLIELVLALGAEMLLLAGLAADADVARDELSRLLSSGAVRERLRQNVERQGGDARFLDDADALGTAPVVRPVLAPADAGGFVVDVDPMVIGRAAMALGAGRRQPGDAVDPLVGVVLAKKRGDPVAPGEPLATVHARDDAGAASAAEMVQASFRHGSEPPAARVLIAARRSS